MCDADVSRTLVTALGLAWYAGHCPGPGMVAGLNKNVSAHYIVNQTVCFLSITSMKKIDEIS